MSEVGYIFPNDAAKQVVEVGNAIKATDDALLKYSEDAQKLVNLLKDQNISFEQLNKAQKQTEETTKQIDAVGKQLIQSEQKLKQVEDIRVQQIIKNRIETQKATKTIKDKIKANDSEEGSLVRMRMRLKELTEAYDKSGTRTKEAAKEIDSLSREIGKAEAATNRHQRGVGGYADQLGQLPGTLGKTAGGLASVGKQMWALVANPIGLIITALVGAFAGLVKIFKSTDEGATAFAGVLKAMGNVVDVIIDRLVSFTKLLWDIATFDLKGIKENGEATFNGIGKALKDAAVAGWEYEQVMDRIKDTESASLIRAAKLRKEIEELTVKSKDRNLGTKEQIRLAELAMQKSKELNELETGFSKQRTYAERNNLASLIEGDNLTIESKQRMLDKWLEIDDRQLSSQLEKDKVFANFYNNNAEAFQNLQKLRAGDIDKETSLVTETRRLQTSLFTFKKELYDEDKRQSEGAKKAKEDEIKFWYLAEKEKAKATEKSFADFDKEIENQVKLNKKSEDKMIDDSISAMAKIQKTKELLIDSAIQDRQRQYQQEIIIAEATAKNETDLRQKIFDINKKYINEDIASVQEQLTNAELYIDDRIALENKLKDLQLENNQVVADDQKAKDKEREERQKKTAESLIEIGQELFEFSISRTQGELEALEEKNKSGQISDEEYARQKAELELKLAKQERNKALFDVAINTAKGIAKAVAESPLTFGLPWAAFAAVTGALQAAAILSKPLPKFAKGTENAPDEFIAGERGRELMRLKTGKLIMANSATHFKGNEFKGATIYSNRETEQIISRADKANNFVFDTQELKSELISVRKAIQKKPVQIVDNYGRVIGIKTNSYREIYLNRLRNGR